MPFIILKHFVRKRLFSFQILIFLDLSPINFIYLIWWSKMIVLYFRGQPPRKQGTESLGSSPGSRRRPPTPETSHTAPVTVSTERNPIMKKIYVSHIRNTLKRPLFCLQFCFIRNSTFAFLDRWFNQPR